MSNCIFSRAPSNMTDCTHDDWPCSFSVASVAVSPPMWKVTGCFDTKSLPVAVKVARS